MVAKPVLDQVNVVVDDMHASIAFYRLLGLEVPDAPIGHHGIAHCETDAGAGAAVQIDFDNLQLAHVYNADWRRDQGSSARLVLGFRFVARDEVDEVYAAITAAGHRGVQPPYDAFWGSRYAIVADPDGNHVGLASARDDSMARWPDVGESPSP